jgi:nucleotide-binding universal stress UspA family protein
MHTSKVIVAYDFSHSARAALDRAIALANRAPFHVLHVICVIEPHGDIPEVPHKGKVDYEYAQRVQEVLTEAIVSQLRAAEIGDRVHICVHARIGKPAEQILELAREIGADLIIVGSKGSTGVERVFLGSVSERVVREAKCTVQVARPKGYAEVQLMDIKEVPHSGHYVPPHRYTYDAHTVNLRPAEWPLY